MKTKNLTLAMLLLVSLLFACENDRIDESPILPDLRLETVSLESDSQLKNIVTAYAEELDVDGYINAFGRVNWNNIIKMTESETVTWSIVKKHNPLQPNELENVIIKQYGGEKSIYIIKFSPDEPNWLASHNLNSDFNTFSGDVTYRNLNNFVFGKSRFIDGESVKPSLTSVRTSTSCDPWVEVEDEDTHFDVGDGFGVLGGYTWYYIPCPDGPSGPFYGELESEGGSGGGTTGSPININNDDEAPCNTGDPILDDYRVRPAFESLWFLSRTELPINMRQERGGWIVRNSSGNLEVIKFPASYTISACKMGYPADILSNLPPNLVGWVHTHPFFEGDNTISVCDPYGTASYTSGVSNADESFFLDLVAASKNLNLKMYVIDGDNISSRDAYKVQKKFSRCGY